MRTGNVTTSGIQDATLGTMGSHVTARSHYAPSGDSKPAKGKTLRENGGLGSISEQVVYTRVDVTMGNNNSNAQPGTLVRHLQPLFEKYDVGIVISGHDEMLKASYVDDDNNGKRTYHWDVGVASDGLRADKRIKQEDGTYKPYRFNTHSFWMAQKVEPEIWKTNENGVKHLASGGKHLGHLEMIASLFSPEIVPAGTAPVVEGGVVPAYSVRMTPIAAFPLLDDNYDVTIIERRETPSNQITVTGRFIK